MNLTPEQLKQNAAAMLAWAEGKPVENRPITYSGKWVVCPPTWAFDEFEYRPAPDPIAPGHNPDRLTVSQVGEGWRLVEKSEGVGIIHSKAWHDCTEFWRLSGGWKLANWVICEQRWSEGDTLRTRLTREELAALDKPAEPKKEQMRTHADILREIADFLDKNHNGAV